jgi:hypothetical protein
MLSRAASDSLQLHMVDILSTFIYYIWFHVVTVIILFCKHWGSHSAFNFLGSVFFEGLKMAW